MPTEPEREHLYDCPSDRVVESETARNQRLSRRNAEIKRWLADLQSWIPLHQDAIAHWEADRAAAIEELTAQFRKSAIAPRVADETHILEAVYDAAEACAGLLRAELNPGSCRVLLFTDLVEFRTGEAPGGTIHLKNVDVIAALVPVSTPGAFEKLRGDWDALFRKAGATNVEILSERLSDGETIAKRLNSWSRK